MIVVRRHNLKTRLRICICALKIKEKYVAMGMGVDIWYGSSKEVGLYTIKEIKSQSLMRGVKNTLT